MKTISIVLLTRRAGKSTEERVIASMAAELAKRQFAPLSAALIEDGRAVPFTPGLPDDCFQRGSSASGRVVPMTKREVRAVAMSQRRLTKEAVCWNAGAGTGLVSIEVALQEQRGKVYAVEKDAFAIDLLWENRERFRARNLESISDGAPEACQEQPMSLLAEVLEI